MARKRPWFNENHFKLLLNYCKAARENPKIKDSEFHKKYSKYKRVKSTSDLIKKAYEFNIITEPVIYTNRGIEVEIFEGVNNPKELLRECEEDPKTKYALALRGEISFIRFKRGASMLSFYQNIIPNYYQESINQIEKLTFTEKGKLPRDTYPHGWSEDHWKIYKAFRFPRRKTFQDIGIELELNRATVKKYYEEVLEQSKIFTSFFPRGVNKYSYQIVLFETEYEVGILRALKRFNRTSYLYKFNNKILLGLFLGPNMKAYEKSADHFAYLEEIGMIHDLRVSIPRDYTKDTL